jgi:hypothetical protein
VARRILILLGLVSMLLPAFGGCGVTEEGGLKPDGGGGSDNDGGGGLAGGQCFPGSKVCPDPSKPGVLLCLTADEPQYGCSQSTACAPCAVPHATAKCNTGACAVDQCDPGWADCDNSPVDGCETDLNGDKNHCGNCATDCVTSKGAGWICTAGTCEVNECCPDGSASCLTRRDCDGNKTNGCEVDVATDVSNCKTCGNACALQNAQSACSQEACVVTVCNSGWANCDLNDVNGCEVNISTGDKGNCGACGKVCNETHAGATCQGGACKLACHPDWGNCDNNVDNGCETSLKTSPLHCNGCAKPCNPANVNAALCTAGACDYDACKPGFADCNGNKADGCEINIAQDKNNCGVCSKVCQAPSGGSVVCSGGNCAESCGSGLTNCSGVCVNTGNDINYCGGCATKCTPPANGTATCGGGSCGFNCNNGFHKCGTECKANNDATNCGASCTTCPGPASGSGTAICTAGTCGFNCVAPTTLKCGNSCYNPTNDKAHCSSCTIACTDPPNGVSNCVTSACKITCNSGFHECSNQCKSDTDATACGSSCTNCPGPTSGTGTPACPSGSCEITCGAPTPTRCGSSCVDTQTDEGFCGSCTNACGSGKTCCGGGCKDLQDDDNHCGTCGKKCSGTESCQSGKCCPTADGGADGGC